MTCHDSLTYYSSLLSVGSDTYIKFLCSTFLAVFRLLCVHTMFYHFRNSLFMYSIYGIEENNVSKENIYYFIWYLKRNNIVVKTLFLCVNYCQGNNPVIIPINNICYSLFYFRHLFVLTTFISLAIFNWFIPLVSVMILHPFLNLHV